MVLDVVRQCTPSTSTMAADVYGCSCVWGGGREFESSVLVPIVSLHEQQFMRRLLCTNPGTCSDYHACVRVLVIFSLRALRVVCGILV